MQGTRLFDRHQDDGNRTDRNLYPGQHKDGILVFVYGTLMEGGGLHRCLENQTFMGEGTIAGRLYNLGVYPGWKQDVTLPKDRVHGEVYRINADTLSHLDFVEGVEGGLYERRAVVASMASPMRRPVKPILQVWAYHYCREVRADERIEQCKPDPLGHSYFSNPMASWRQHQTDLHA